MPEHFTQPQHNANNQHSSTHCTKQPGNATGLARAGRDRNLGLASVLTLALLVPVSMATWASTSAATAATSATATSANAPAARSATSTSTTTTARTSPSCTVKKVRGGHIVSVTPGTEHPFSANNASGRPLLNVTVSAKTGKVTKVTHSVRHPLQVRGTQVQIWDVSVLSTQKYSDYVRSMFVASNRHSDVERADAATVYVKRYGDYRCVR